MLRWYVPGLLSLLATADWLRAEPPAESDARGSQFFEKKIRPVLAGHCFACQSSQAQTNKKLKGGLFLDRRDRRLQGGDSGPAVVPGQAEQSLLIQALRYQGDLGMP